MPLSNLIRDTTLNMDYAKPLNRSRPFIQFELPSGVIIPMAILFVKLIISI